MRDLITLTFKEMRYRWINATLTLLAVAAAVGLLVTFLITADAANRETRRIQRDLGTNLRIIPGNTDMAFFRERGYSDQTMPIENINELAAIQSAMLNHLRGKLLHEMQVEGQTLLLKGQSSSQNTPGNAQTQMFDPVAAGSVELGYEAARLLDATKGQTITLYDMPLQVARVGIEKGNAEDLEVYLNLTDLQTMLDMPNLVHEIEAIDCLRCQEGEKPTIELLTSKMGEIREQVDEAVPGLKVFMAYNDALTRAQQREATENFLAMLVPVLLIGTAICIACLAYLNARDRVSEVGVLLALGNGSPQIMAMFMGKALILGFVGAVVGYLVGVEMAVSKGPDIFFLTAKKIQPTPNLIYQALLGAPLFAAAITLLPVMLATGKDPATILREP